MLSWSTRCYLNRSRSSYPVLKVTAISVSNFLKYFNSLRKYQITLNSFVRVRFHLKGS